MTESTNTGSEDSLTLEQLFGVLRHRARRVILLSLLDRASYDLGEFAEQRNDVGGRESGPSDLELRHVHFPYLAERDVVRWDPDAGTVSRGRRFDEIRPMLELLRDRQGLLPEEWP